ncbi:MAG: Phosphatidylinositol glycan, class [Parcubacteria group bacterium]|nr:Phosphatidylinositol glycan, class [Parcubacteria group bacterium]
MQKETPLKVLIGITKSNFGGAQRYVYELARGSKDRGFNTTVLLGGNGTLAEKLRSRDIRVISFPLLSRDISLTKDFKEFLSLVRTLRAEKPDVFHVNSSKMGGLGTFAARILRVPHIIFTGHSFAFNEQRPWVQKMFLRFLYWLTILFSHKTICVSEAGMNRISHWPFIKNKLVLIHNGIPRFDMLSREEARNKLNLKPETFVVGTIAELHRVKGLDILLRAWVDFIKVHPTSHLVIIGDGDEGDNLNLLAKKLKIDHTVTFAGFVDNARKLLPAFDVFVLASRSEGFPYALLEAGRAGLPVVATSVGGVGEIISEGETGLLVQPEYPEELCHVLTGLSSDASLRATLKHNLNSFVEKEFSLEQMFSKTFALYE